MRSKFTFIVAGILILAAVIYLVVSSTTSTAQYYLTVEELKALGDQALDRQVTVSGAVLGHTIAYDPMAPRVDFTIVHIPGDPQEIKRAGGLDQILQQVKEDPTASRLEVRFEGAKPDMLRDEAQAIMRGNLLADGSFDAEELRLKCPSRYAEKSPDRVGE
jgi:cytochrome c-type biogenesis protein CcmE